MPDPSVLNQYASGTLLFIPARMIYLGFTIPVAAMVTKIMVARGIVGLSMMIHTCRSDSR